MKSTTVIKIGFLLGAITVILGAFGAHYLADKLLVKGMNAYHTAVKYQFFHALLLIIIGLNSDRFKPRNFKIASVLLLLGILFFSGSIYLLSTRTITQISFTKILGPLTPIGGLLLIAAWVLLAMGIKSNTDIDE